jgi:FemAB-related protein (PEP-CTERM system-associated)
MEVVSLTAERVSRWNAYVDAHPQGRIYHRTEWMNITERAFGKKPLYRLVLDGEQITGILPVIRFHTFLVGKQLISLPYVNYGGPLWSNEQAKDLILQEIENLRIATASEAVEIRYDQPDAFPFAVKTSKVTFLLDLPDDADVLWKGFKAKLRSQIRRPIKEEMYAKSGGLELLDDFYYVFCRNMRHLGTPVYGKNIFRTILQTLPERAFLTAVYTRDHKPVAAAFLLGYKDTLEIPWASSLRKYNRFSPNMLLYWEVLKQAIEKGYRVFDFGRGTKEGGTYRFKKQWGGREVQLYWYYALAPGESLPEVNKENPKYQLAIKIWQKLPLWFTNTLGPGIVKNLP